MPRGTYLWRLPTWANDRFERLMDELQDLQEGADRYYAILDEIRSLPGFPAQSTTYDLIRREVTTVR